jgi:hypothetical protein
MNQAQVPQFADGGYWYVFPATAVVDDPPGWEFPDIPEGAAWYAEIGGVMTVAVRSPNLYLTIDSNPETVADVLSLAGYSGNPFARIRGK